MVAKFLDDNQPKTKRIRTIPNSIDLIKFHLIRQILAKFSEVESEWTVHLSKFRKRKRNFLCRVPLLHTAGVRKIRKFQVAAVQQRLRLCLQSGRVALVLGLP